MMKMRTDEQVSPRFYEEYNFPNRTWLPLTDISPQSAVGWYIASPTGSFGCDRGVESCE